MTCWGGRSGAAEAAIHGGQVGRRVDVLPARVIVDSEFEQRPAVAGEHSARALVAVERAQQKSVPVWVARRLPGTRWAAAAEAAAGAGRGEDADGVEGTGGDQA